MSEREFLEKLKDDIIFTEQELALTTELKSIAEWDSLSFVNFAGYANACGKKITKEDSKNFVTVGDLFRALS